MTRRLFAFVPLLVGALTGCIYSDVRAPLSYRSPTPLDVGGNLGAEAQGEACNTAILWLVAWGDGGYDAAVKDARESSHAAVIADVKADTKYTNVLFGIYQRQCTTITGRVGGLTAFAAPPPPPPPLAPPPPPPPPPSLSPPEGVRP
jgi:hypothetical protein